MQRIPNTQYKGDTPTIVDICIVDKEGRAKESIREKLGRQRIQAAKKGECFKCFVQLDNDQSFTLKVHEHSTNDRKKALGLAASLVTAASDDFRRKLSRSGVSEAGIVSESYYSLFCQMQAIRFRGNHEEFGKGFDDFQEVAELAMANGDADHYGNALLALSNFIAEKLHGSRVDVINEIDDLLADIDRSNRSESPPKNKQVTEAPDRDVAREWRGSSPRSGDLADSEDGSEPLVADPQVAQKPATVGRAVKPQAALVEELNDKFSGVPGQKLEKRSPVAKEKVRKQVSDRSGEAGVNVAEGFGGALDNASLKGVSKKRNETSKSMFAVTNESFNIVMNETQVRPGKKTTAEDVRKRYLQPLDMSCDELKTRGRRRDKFGEDAYLWWTLVEREVHRPDCGREINKQLLQNMCQLLAADCQGVMNHLGSERYMRRSLQKAKAYFKQQAKAFAQNDKRSEDQLRADATAFANKCSEYTRKIIEFSNFKLDPKR